MPKITAIIHVCNDAGPLARALTSLRPCDEVLVINHGSEDDTANVAKQHGAKVKAAILGVDECAYTVDAGNDWILCILPSEVLSEEMEAALIEWKGQDPDEHPVGFGFDISEQNGDGWHSLGFRMRLMNRQRVNWTATLPPDISNMPKLRGSLLRFNVQGTNAAV